MLLDEVKRLRELHSNSVLLPKEMLNTAIDRIRSSSCNVQNLPRLADLLLPIQSMKPSNAGYFLGYPDEQTEKDAGVESEDADAEKPSR